MKIRIEKIRMMLVAVILFAVVMPAFTQEAASDLEMVYKIRQEGQRNSDIEKLAYIMTDLAGPRLTGSAGIDRANEIARAKLAEYGLSNVRIEEVSDFNRGGDASARQYIDGMRDGAVAGFKYFDLSGTTGISLTTRGDAGNFVVATDEEFTNVLGVVPLEASCEWRTFSATLAPDDDNVALFLRYFGSGRVDLLELELR